MDLPGSGIVFSVIFIGGLGVGLVSLLWLVGRHLRFNIAASQKRRALEHSSTSPFLLYQYILDTLPFPIWQRDPNLQLTYCNQAYANMLGASIHQVIEEQRELTDTSSELADQAQQAGQAKHVRKHLVHHGARTLFQLTEQPIGNQLIGFANNLSETEKIEQEYKEYAQAQSELLSSSKSAIAMFDRDQCLTFFNPAYAQLWTLDPDWLNGKPSYTDILERLREKRKLPEQANFQAFKKEALSLFTSVIQKHEEYYYLPDDTVVRVFVVPHEHGGLLFSYEDMTDVVNLERSYNTLISVKKSTIDHLNEGLAVFAEDGRLTLFNPAFCTMWQLDSALCEGEPKLADIAARMAEQIVEKQLDDLPTKDALLSHIQERKQWQQQFTTVSDHTFLLSLIPLPDGGMLCIFNDISDSYRVEQSLRAEKEALSEADTIKTKFLANVSYELRSPLTTIQGYTEALKNGLFGAFNDKQNEYFAKYFGLE